jgi:hypothetical protein
MEASREPFTLFPRWFTITRQQLFVYRDLWVWIDHPFQAPELPEALSEQLTMAWQ